MLSMPLEEVVQNESVIVNFSVDSQYQFQLSHIQGEVKSWTACH